MMMAVAQHSLSQFACLRSLGRDSLNAIARESALLTVRPGAMLYAQNGPPAGLYILKSGHVKLFRQSGERIQILSIVAPGDLFGAESLADESPSPLTATALTATVVLYVPPEEVQALVSAFPDFQHFLLTFISARLQQFVSRVHDLAFRDVPARLAHVLLEQVEREGRPFEQGILIDRLLSQQDLAALVGTAREVVYRTFRKMEQDGILHQNTKSILILDLARLTELAGQETR